MNKADTNNCIYTVANTEELKQKVLKWLSRFNTFCFLDNHFYQNAPHNYDWIAAAGVKDFVQASSGNALARLQHFIDEKPRWLFGHLGYDLKNEIEQLHSSHCSLIQFPDLYFFEPEVLIMFQNGQMQIQTDDASAVYDAVSHQPAIISSRSNAVQIQQQLRHDEYIRIIEKLKQHILRGDCYEINFCQEFFAEQVSIHPLTVYQNLSALSPNPFSAFYRVNQDYLLCASPERFLKKENKKILSQPIKGTLKRTGSALPKEKEQLYQSQKDRSENVMVVDLVRNDLSRVCKNGSVKVEELFGIYSFPQVHQMISTISGELTEKVSFSEIIRGCFPMGSMTGAPKKKVMELIEEYETTRRGIFSGAVGYIKPNGDFDLNVVIRSILYNQVNQYLSFQTGSGITFYSNAEKEWEECLVKAEAMLRVLTKAEN